MGPRQWRRRCSPGRRCAELLGARAMEALAVLTSRYVGAHGVRGAAGSGESLTSCSSAGWLRAATTNRSALGGEHLRGGGADADDAPVMTTTFC